MMAVWECGLSWVPEGAGGTEHAGSADTAGAAEHAELQCVDTAKVMASFCLWIENLISAMDRYKKSPHCLLYTSDAADE